MNALLSSALLAFQGRHIDVRRVFWLFLTWLVATAAVANDERTPRLYFSLSPKPDPMLMAGFDVCILNPAAQVDFDKARASGTRLLAYLDLTEVSTDSAAAAAARGLSLPLKLVSATAVRMDVCHPDWPSVAVRHLAQAAATRGFDGFALAGYDGRAGAAASYAWTRLITALRTTFPEKKLVMTGGINLWHDTCRSLDGVLILQELGHPHEVLINAARRLGLDPYVVEIASSTVDKAAITSRARDIRQCGGIPFFTTSKLDGTNLGPLRAAERRIVVLHSGPAAETFTASILHGSLEWLGYRVSYRQVPEENPAEACADAAAVILDREWYENHQATEKLAELVTHLVEKRLPLLLTALPSDPGLVPQIARTLGLRGTCEQVQAPTEGAVALHQTPLLAASDAVSPRLEKFRDLQAPGGANVVISLRSRGSKRLQFDQVFLASWGGLWLDPLAPIAGPQVNPIEFLQRWLQEQPMMPAMDVASQAGRQLLVCHVGSDGFAEVASLPGLPLASEAMTEHVFQASKLPFTVALCEGTLRGITPEAVAEDSLRYRQAARRMLALPHIAAASATFSEPLNWSPQSFQPGPLPNASSALGSGIEREIAGSLAFIHRNVLPLNAAVSLVAWPGNAAPSAAAVTFSRRMGVENVSFIDPGTLGRRNGPLSPVTWGEGTALQVSLQSPQRGRLRAEEQIKTFSRTMSAPYKQPLILNLTFRDALSEVSLKETQSLLSWCASQSLHPMNAADYARLVRDAAETSVVPVAPGHWLILNRGFARTLRLPIEVGMPDLQRCIGISGYTASGQCLYVHTKGHTRTELVLRSPVLPEHERLSHTPHSVEVPKHGRQPVELGLRTSRPGNIQYGAKPPIQVTSTGDSGNFIPPAIAEPRMKP